MRQKRVKIASKMRGTPLGENTFWTITIIWRAGTTPILKKNAPRIWAEILAFNQFRESLRELLRE